MKRITFLIVFIVGSFCNVQAAVFAETLDVHNVVRKIQAVYDPNCCFTATFDQLTVNISMDMRDQFQGRMYVRKPVDIALDVISPERQRVVMKGRAYTVYFYDDGSQVNGEVPPEINIENFFGFFTNISALDKNFTIELSTRQTEPEDKMIFLELTNTSSSQAGFKIVLGVDSHHFTIKRAIIYDALGNYNRFDLFNITFLKSIPDSRFETKSPQN
ncbi:MAG: outer membrane lipoprotein carrier protein LolA [Deltaproteobacteria bacterium]|nr:outer membrane lipoprotein carrier protein LolA [Deltaproteobacteria bacterium]